MWAYHRVVRSHPELRCDLCHRHAVDHNTLKELRFRRLEKPQLRYYAPVARSEHRFCSMAFRTATVAALYLCTLNMGVA